MTQKCRLVLALMVLLAVLAACGGATTSPPPTVVSPTPTKPPAPTMTPQPTATAKPTATLQPTAAPKPTATAAERIGKVGEAVTASGVALTVEKASREQGKLTLSVLIENVSNKEAQPYHPYYFNIKDSDGYGYPGVSSFVQPALMGGSSLAQGEKARGNVAFNIPDAAKGLVLTYRPPLPLNGYSMKVDLGQ